MKCLAAALLLAFSVPVAAQEPRTVAEAALSAWTSHDAQRFLPLAHPELLQRLRHARLLQFYIAGKKDKQAVVASGSDADVVSLFCEALQSIVPPQDSRLEYFDQYLDTKIRGDSAVVEFDSGWRRKSDGTIGLEVKKQVVLRKFDGEWRFLWSPAVGIHVDLEWNPTQ